MIVRQFVQISHVSPEKPDRETKLTRSSGGDIQLGLRDIHGGDSRPGTGQGKGRQVVSAAEYADRSAGHVAEVFQLNVIQHEMDVVRDAPPVHPGVDLRLPSVGNGVPAPAIRLVHGMLAHFLKTS